MKSQYIVVSLLTLFLAFIASNNLHAQAVLSSPELNWTTERGEALKKAQASGSPILFYLYNRKAIGCRDMEQITFREPQVVEKMKEFQLVAIDVDEDTSLRRMLKIVKVPTVIFYTNDGREMFRAVGHKPAEEFLHYANAMPSSRGRRTSAGGDAPADATVATPAYNPSLRGLEKRENTTKQIFAFYAPQANQVVLAGDFNDWSTELMPMTKDQKGWHSIALFLPDGIYEYKFVVDGEWTEDPNSRHRKFVPDFGSYNNILIVGNVPERPAVSNGGATFLYYNRDATAVSIAGTFTNWQQVPLFAKGDGNWGIQYDLPRGTHQYKYVVDGNWITDPGNFRTELDSGGNANSAVTIP